MSLPYFPFAPLITRSSSAQGVEKLHHLYKTVFQQDVPIADKSNHLRVFLAIYDNIGCKKEPLNDLRETLPSLSHVKWEDVASIGGLDPTKGREQLEHIPVRFEATLTIDLILGLQRELRQALKTYKLPSRHTEEAQHVHLTSYVCSSQVVISSGSLLLLYR